MDQINNHPLYRKHNIDSAMSSLWEFYKNKFIALFLISFAMSLVIQYASSLINFKELQTVTDPMVILEMMKDYIVPILIVSLVNLLFTTILQYYILFGPLNNEDSLFVLLSKSLKYFVPYLITIILLAFVGSIAILLGIFVIIIGAFFAILYVMTLYLFILPIMMVEGPNIGNTIRRTFSLAHRNFWSNMGWVSIFLIILIVISVVFSGLILLPFTGSFIKTLMNPEDASNLIDVTKNPIFIGISAIVSALTMPLMPIFSAILYFNGKAGEEQDHLVIKPDSVNEKVKVEDLYAKPYSDDHPDNPDKIV